jgi:pimeloyl-ACP methyl ester carboxylesterase
MSISSRSRRRTVWIAAVLAGGIAAILVVAIIQRGGHVAQMPTSGTVTSADGTVIAYSQLGHGPALVLVDGALCFRQNGPSPDIAPLLASHFTVYAYDRRGRGESGDTPPYTIAREIEDLKAVIDRAGDSAFVFASSSGAALAMQGAAAGLPIRKLALYEPPIGVSRPNGPSLEESQQHLAALVAAGDRAGAVRYFLEAVLGVPRGFVAVMPVLMPRTWSRNKAVASTLPFDLAILNNHSLLGERAKKIGIPTLVIGGAKSPAYLQEALERIARALPSARTRLLPGQSHDVSAARKALVPVLASFFSESHGRGSGARAAMGPP